MRPATLDQPPLFRLVGQDGARVTLDSDTGARAEIFVLEADLVRLLVLPTGRLNHTRSWTVAPGADDVALEGRDRFDLTGFTCPEFRLDQSDAESIVIETAQIRLSIRLRNLACHWSVRLQGAWVPAMRDRPTQAYDFGWWGGGVYHYLARVPGEQYFGLGERSGALDRAGRRFRLSNLDAMGYDAETSDPLYKHIPFYLTRRPESGLVFGVFYDTLADCSVDFGCEHSNYHGPYRVFAADHGDLDLYFLAGPTVPAVVRRFTWLTGRPAATPDWALAYSGSAMGYTDAPDAQARMGQFLDDLARHDIPCGSFHLSSGYGSIGDKRYVFHWNRDKFPDPKGFVADYAAAGVRLLANIKPVLLTDHPQFQAAAENRLLLSDAAGVPVLEQFWGAPGAYLDFTNPAAIAWWQDQVTATLLDLGIAATWNDNNEYEIRNPRALAHGFRHALSGAGDEAAPDHADAARLARGAGGACPGPAALPDLARRCGRNAALCPNLVGRQLHLVEDAEMEHPDGARPGAVGRIQYRPRCRRLRRPAPGAGAFRALGRARKLHATLLDPFLER